jgi:hypothetical protein
VTCFVREHVDNPSGSTTGTGKLLNELHTMCRFLTDNLSVFVDMVNKVFQLSKKISGGVTGFFSDIFPSDRTTALGSTQALVKMSTRNIPGGKGGRCVRLTTSPPSRVKGHEIWEPKPPGTL